LAPWLYEINTELISRNLAGRNASAEKTFRKDQDAFLAGVKGIEWKRPNEWGDTTAKVVMWSGGIDPDDVAQVYVNIKCKVN
jgi:hypothetical protein